MVNSEQHASVVSQRERDVFLRAASEGLLSFAPTQTMAWQKSARGVDVLVPLGEPLTGDFVERFNGLGLPDASAFAKWNFDALCRLMFAGAPRAQQQLCLDFTHLIAVLDDRAEREPSSEALLHLFDDVLEGVGVLGAAWRDIVTRAVDTRWRAQLLQAAMVRALAGQLEEQRVRLQQTALSVPVYAELRNRCAGMEVYALLFACRGAINEIERLSPASQRFVNLSNTLTWMANDVLTVHVDARRHNPANVVLHDARTSGDVVATAFARQASHFLRDVAELHDIAPQVAPALRPYALSALGSLQWISQTRRYDD